MPKMTKEQRKKVETMVLESMDKIDKSGTNSDYYRQLFANMSDTQFYNLMKKQLPFRFHDKPSITEPSMSDCIEALDYLGVPLMETITFPYFYKNKDGVPVSGQEEAMVVYLPLKKVQQFVTKKNKWAPEISNRDMKTGRLLGGDKGAGTSDREFESLAISDLTNTMKEFSGPKADSMAAMNAMYNTIGTTGIVRLEDLPDSVDDSLARNMFNVYLIGSHLNSNLINQGDYTMYTIKDRRRAGVERS